MHGALFEVDEDGWDIVKCTCGSLEAPSPDVETSADIFASHCQEALLIGLDPLFAAVDAVTRAWTDPGPRADFHKAEQDRLLKRWPTLAGAVVRLVEKAPDPT